MAEEISLLLSDILSNQKALRELRESTSGVLLVALREELSSPAVTQAYLLSTS